MLYKLILCAIDEQLEYIVCCRAIKFNGYIGSWYIIILLNGTTEIIPVTTLKGARGERGWREGGGLRAAAAYGLPHLIIHKK